MADESGLAGLDPYDLMDLECQRLSAWFGSLDTDGWALPSACEGWSRRDLLAHLVAVEEYFEACLSGTVAGLMQRYADAGAAGLDDLNSLGVQGFADRDTADLLSTWVEESTENCAGYRAADGGDVDTSVGAYPCRLQAFHAVHEYATHANDVDAPVSSEEFDARQGWLAGISRFALTEVKEDVTVTDVAGGFSVSDPDVTATLDRDQFVLGVSGRYEAGTFDPPVAALLDLGY